MKTLLSALMIGAVALSGPAFAGSNATGTESKGEIHHVWMEETPDYEFVHPLQVTCKEFTEAKEVYRPYVVAWLTGHARHNQVTEVVTERYVPVSVPQVVETCKASPNLKVSELVERMSLERQ